MQENVKIQPLIVNLDFDSKSLSKLVNILKPTVFEEDHVYCCVYGDDYRTAISGFGHTAHEAIEDWEASLRKRMKLNLKDDQLLQGIFAKLGAQASMKQAS